MTSYAFWNNKGGVGKSYLTFVAACEYAHAHPDTLVFVIDLCPQANSSEILLGSDELASSYRKLIDNNARKSIGGYAEERLNSPFRMIKSFNNFITKPRSVNRHIPENVRLIAGDYILEVLSEAMRQAAQLSVPLDAWGKVMSWVKDMVDRVKLDHENRDTFFIFDCNPSFAIYTQMALAAAERLVIPFTADDSSRRAIENVIALSYGIGDEKTTAYARISFARKALEHGINPPKIHSFVNNRVTYYEGKPSAAFRAASERVKETVDNIYKLSREPFFFTRKPSGDFIEIPDYHSAAIVSSITGTPVHQLKAGPRVIKGERIQLNKEPLDRYRAALQAFIARL